MKTLSERLRGRRTKNRPMVTINLRMPEDVIEDLKEIAPTMGFSGYQPLMRAYIGRGLREDLFKLEDAKLQPLTESLIAAMFGLLLHSKCTGYSKLRQT